MGKYECIAVCVLFVSVAAVLCCIALSGCTTSLAYQLPQHSGECRGLISPRSQVQILLGAPRNTFGAIHSGDSELLRTIPKILAGSRPTICYTILSEKGNPEQQWCREEYLDKLKLAALSELRGHLESAIMDLEKKEQ